MDVDCKSVEDWVPTLTEDDSVKGKVEVLGSLGRLETDCVGGGIWSGESRCRKNSWSDVTEWNSV